MNEVLPIAAEFMKLGLPEPKDAAQARKLWEASKAMEAQFSQFMLKELGNTSTGFGHMPGGKIYGDMFKQSVAEEIASSNSLGLAKQIYLFMSDKMEESKNES